MMKKILFANFMIIVIFATAQVTINSNNIIGVNEVAISSVDTIPPAIDLLGSGNQTWDFTMLEEDRIDSTMFTDATGTTYATEFPNANMEADDGNIFIYVLNISTPPLRKSSI
jgi:hypothetical protein